MLIEHLTLTAFRNYPNLRLFTDSRNVVLLGKNGAGKTNILEAVSLLVPGRGLRGTSYQDLYCRSGQNPLPWAVAAALRDPQTSATVRLATAAPQNAPDLRDSRDVFVNSQRQSSQEALAPYMRMVWLTPQIERLFSEDAVTQKRFWDQLIAQRTPSHRGRLRNLRKLTQQRLKILTDARLAAAHPDRRWLESLEAQMAATLAALTASRLEFLKELSAFCASSDGIFPSVRLEAAPRSLEAALLKRAALDLEEDIAVLLKENRGADAQARQTGGRLHIAFDVRCGENNTPAALCSTGEQKALLIGVMLAYGRLIEEKTGRRPLFLLDEIGAHLDKERCLALFRLLEERPTQLWLSGTDPELFRFFRPSSRFFHCQDGGCTLLEAL